MTSTLEQASPRSTSYGLAAALPLALAGLIITAVLTVVVGIIGLIVGLVITVVAVVVRMRTFAAGIDAAILGQLGAKPADGPEAAGLRNLAEGLSATAGVPMPELLILDEPAAGIPAGESAELFAVIAALPRDITVLFIEHDMDLVFRFAERITVLVAGAVLAEGTPAEIAADRRVKEVYLGESTHG